MKIYVTYNIYEYPVLLLCRIFRKPILFFYVDEYDKLTTTPAAKPYLRFALKRFLSYSSYVVCTAKVLERKASKHNNHVTYLPNAVNLRHKQESSKKTSKTFTVGFLGSIEPWVNYRILVDAARKNPATHFSIIGSGSQLENFKQEARGLNNIEFHGQLPHAEVFSHIAAWNLATIPFHRNEITDSVSPVKLFEYWLCEVPVAATMTTELLAYKDVLLSFETSKELSEIIKKNKKELQQYGKLGKQLVLEKYNWQRYQQIYKELVETLTS